MKSNRCDASVPLYQYTTLIYHNSKRKRKLNLQWNFIENAECGEFDSVFFYLFSCKNAIEMQFISFIKHWNQSSHTE